MHFGWKSLITRYPFISPQLMSREFFQKQQPPVTRWYLPRQQ